MSVAWLRTPEILGRLPFRLLLLVMLTTCLCQWPMAASEPETQRIIHESWTFKDGAPEAVAALAQTADGYLWLGTEFGLFRFDGTRFERFRSRLGDQLMSTNIATLFADSAGGLWVGYLFGGVSFVKNGTVKNFSETVAPTKTLLGFAEDRHGVLWAATGTGLWRFDGSAWQALTKDWNAPGGIIYQVGFDRDGILWALAGWSDTGRQLFYLLPGSEQFKKAGENLAAKFTWDADHKVLTSHEPGSKETGINLDHSLPAFPLLRKDSGQIVDRANGIWIMPIVAPFLMHHATGGSLTETLGNFSPENSEVYDVNPNHFAFLVDREGAVWFGDSKGLHRFSYSPLLNQEFPKAAPTFALAAGEAGAVWVVAGDYNATTVYRVADGKAIERSQENLQNFAYRASDGSLWFGGKAGLWHLAEGRFKKIELPPDVAHNAFGPRAITQDGSGGLWVSFSGNVLYRFADGTWTLNGGRQDLPPQLILTEFTDSVGRVWFGNTRSRLTVLERGRLLAFGPHDGVSVGNVTAIYGRGPEVWIGGEFGLQQFDHGRFHSIEAVENEWLRGISGIVETANGDLWLNSVGGIVHIRHAEVLEALRSPHFKVAGDRLGRREGLPGLPSQIWPLATAVEGADGRIWFTVHNGVVWLDPTRAFTKIPPPAVRIQAVSADDKAYGIDLPMQLPAHTSNVQISYAAISLMDPEAIRYRYKLLGIDKDWHPAATSTSVSYRNLPPGSYHFLVNASDSDGRWSDDTATADFTILPAYYQTNWFRAVCAMFLLALLWAIYQWRLRQLHHQFEMTLDARVGERTRIARELHDTLLQSFHGLLLRFQTVSQLLPGRPVEAKEKLNSAIEQAAEAITEGRDTVQGLRDSTTQTNDLALAISTLGEELAANSTGDRPQFRVAVEGQSRDLHPILRDEVYKIAAEALRNAFLHAKAQQVEVEIRYDNDRFQLRVRDDGKGIDAAILSATEQRGTLWLAGHAGARQAHRRQADNME